MNFKNYKFHCSSLGKLMTKPRKRSESLSETTKKYLHEIYIEEVYGRKKDITNKYMEKGTLVEEDSISLLTEYSKKFFKKNDKTFENEYLIGTPDIVLDSEIIDIKSCWDLWTYFEAEMSDMYEWQLFAYMWLTGKKKASLAYCLVDTPIHLIKQEVSRIAFRAGIYDTSDEYVQLIDEMEKNMTYSDIPLIERVRMFKTNNTFRSHSDVINKIVECRAYLQTLDMKLFKS